MTRILFILVICLSLFGCDTLNNDESSENTEASTSAIATVEETFFEFTVDDIMVLVDRPEEWSVNATRYGVVFTERIRSIATEGQLDGILLHIFVDPLENVAISANDRRNNLALEAFNQIVIDSSYVGDAFTSVPQPIDWMTLDAAYYLLANGDRNVSIVLGVIAPDTNRMVTIVLSAPLEQAERIRQSLPDLLTTFTVNGITLGSVSLETLPDPLEFPVSGA